VIKRIFQNYINQYWKVGSILARNIWRWWLET